MIDASRPLRVIQIVGTDVGGAWFYDQVTTLAGRGLEIVAVVPREGDLSKRLMAAGIRTEIIDFKGSSVRTLPRFIKAEVQLLKLIRDFRPDILHAHLLKAILAGRVAGFLGKVPVRVSQWPGSVHLDSRTFRWLDRGTMWIDHMILGSCTYIADRYKSIGATRVAINHYGCHVERIDPSTSGDAFREEFAISSSEGAVGMIAHMYPTSLEAYRDIGVKGHEVFIDAAALVLQSHPHTRFFIVGDELVGDGSYRLRLEQRASQLGLDARMHFTGHRNDIENVLAAMDVLVNPSLSESASYTMIEALLMKKCVVASNVGGLPDTVQSEKTGILVPPRDAEALAHAIKRHLDAPEAGHMMALRGRERVLQQFNIEYTVDELIKIYKDLLSSGGH